MDSLDPAPLRLGVNIDHVATVRNARGGLSPAPARAAALVEAAGADGVTVHLREDRRHIRDEDLDAVADATALPINLEMAATEEMRAIALRRPPHAVCLVPERRAERTTEGGLNVAGDDNRLKDFIAPLAAAGCRVSLFIAADAVQIAAAARVGAAVVELHTGDYCHALADADVARADRALEMLADGARRAADLGLEVHAGHGLDFDSVGPVAAIREVVEVNIGHFLIGEAIFVGLDAAVREMRARMDAARAGGAAR